MVEGDWHIPWEVSLEINRIRVLKEGLNVAIEHTLREGNKLADFMANIVFSFAGTNFISYNNFQDFESSSFLDQLFVDYSPTNKNFNTCILENDHSHMMTQDCSYNGSSSNSYYATPPNMNHLKE